MTQWRIVNSWNCLPSTFLYQQLSQPEKNKQKSQENFRKIWTQFRGLRSLWSSNASHKSHRFLKTLPNPICVTLPIEEITLKRLLYDAFILSLLKKICTNHICTMYHPSTFIVNCSTSMVGKFPNFNIWSLRELNNFWSFYWYQNPFKVQVHYHL